MPLLKGITKMIHQFDLFCSSQLLRYNSETQYKTMTGGLLSLSIIIVIIVGFANMISDTLKRTSITSSLTTVKQSEPPLVTLNPGPQSMYMLGLSIQSWDLSYMVDLFEGQQYMSVQMNLIKLENGIPTFAAFQLEQCTRQHWSMMPDFNQNFDSFGINKWACLPLNTPFPIQGSYTSSVAYEMLINVYKCQNSTLNNSSCASQLDIDTLFATYQNFYLTYNYVNPVINTNEQDYISYYVQGNDYIIFSKDIGAEAWVYFSDYEISTDNSIWPFEDTKVERGCIVEQKGVNHPFSVSDNASLASVSLAKSPNSLKYKRSVQKISAVFSYIGGLIGAITAVLFFVNIYTDISLEISIGVSLFEEKHNEKEEKEKQIGNFNILGFIRLTFYRFLRLVGWKGLWSVPQRIEKYQNEAVKQLDVQLLLKRLIKLQVCMAHLFTPQELGEIRGAQKITIENAKKMRTLFLEGECQKEEQILQVLISSAISMINQNQINADKAEQDREVTNKMADLQDIIEEQKISQIQLNTNTIKSSQTKEAQNECKVANASNLKIHFLRQR